MTRIISQFARDLVFCISLILGLIKGVLIGSFCIGLALTVRRGRR
jgi:hypothetical protein